MKFTAVVTKGKGRGLDLGCPTANLDIQGEVGLPEGVYYGKTQYKNKVYNSVIVIGAGHRKLESWLYGFDGDLYGQTLTVEVGKKFSELAHVDDYQELHDKIKNDIATATKLWTREWKTN